MAYCFCLSDRRAWKLACIASFLVVWPAANAAAKEPRPIVTSNMDRAEALEGLPDACPVAIRDRQELFTVEYLGFDGKVHLGQIVADRELVDDLKSVFRFAREANYPIQSVIPISHTRFRKDGRWDDDLSMEANNTSAFNYRKITGGTKLSMHALGRAIDINPMQNPYIRGEIVLPPDAKYNPKAPGTLTKDHVVVKAFLKLGWEWGGDWTTRKDYQHFEKPITEKTKAPQVDKGQ